ncbi:MAG: Flp pilus assembly complex ATPase component TadA [Chitinispirillales bacterium]|jgi:type IV pilus assembly protein PilB|nr:Flp pilus assembly complex ATPase component TadA [Chitinispirillales bacterium]
MMVADKRYKKLGEVLLAQKLINEEQLLTALRECRRTDSNLGSTLVQLKFMSQEDLTAILGEQIQLKQKKRIGEILVEQGLITPEQLTSGLEEQKVSRELLGKCLVKLGFITESKLIDILSAQLDIQHVVLQYFNFSKELIRCVPEEMARKHRVIPMYEQNGVLTVAMTDPTNLRTIDHIKFKTGKEIEPVIASEKSIMEAIEKNYSSGLEEMTQILGNAGDAQNALDVVKSEDDNDLLTDEEGAQVVKLVNLLVNQAISSGASDIHLEPLENYTRLRYRIDGDLVEQNPIPLQLRAQITSRLKIMSGMDIAEKRKPQDGRFRIRHEGREIDLRVSTFPVMTRLRGVNEKIVMRILDPQSMNITIEMLGFLPGTKKLFEDTIAKPDGIVLVTGPTGSGKSSTLYAALKRIYSVDINIVTMEDPVEFNLDGISQGQINALAGFTFAAGMRSILRQDPDVVMIGEMRDPETCQMAIQAALTGHLVFSTLHTNDAASAYTRLIDMGLEPFLYFFSVIGILAQRLVRRLCKCKEQYDPDPALCTRLGLRPGLKFYKTKGCKQCNNTGFKGRVGVYEFLVPDENVTRMVLQRSPAEQIKQYCLKRGNFDTLRRDGLKKVIDGTTTIEQVIGSTQDD